MANIAELNLAPNEPLNLDDYATVGGGGNSKFPRKGQYTLRAADAFPQEAFGTSKAGALTVQIDPTIVGPTNEGKTLKFTRISAKTYQRKGKSVSKVGDYLKACGVSGNLNNAQAIADAVETTAGEIFEAGIDWRAYGKEADGTVVELEGMENFPTREDGSFIPYVESKTLTNEDGTAKKFWANLEITYFVPRT